MRTKLADLRLHRVQIAAAVGNVIGRMAHPGSELATHAWLQQRSALGELIGYDYEAMDLNRLYRASDALYKHREALQDHLFSQAQSIFGFGETVTLYDLTNTYFEGIAAGVGKAKRGHSKESRSDCPLVTLAMALDGSLRNGRRINPVFARDVPGYPRRLLSTALSAAPAAAPSASAVSALSASPAASRLPAARRASPSGPSAAA